MSKLKPRKHERKISDLIADNKDSARRIDKRQVNLKVAAGADATGELGATMTPSEEQLDKINRFTRVNATADNVVAFPVMSCNDIYDRDDEKFTTRCVNDFAGLDQPFSPVGKSYMTDHEYKVGNAKGRIFDTAAKTVDGNRWLTCEVYVPKTPQYADFIEAIDFGINWAVSVGVVIDAANCSICQGTVYNSRWFGSWCENGHEKGFYYVPGKEEDDGWGFYLPVDPAEKGAVKAMVDLSAPRDFYELSQVFLGAQYMAELAKKPGFQSMMKAATAKGVPILGLSSLQASKLPMPTMPEQLIEARAKYAIDRQKDGTEQWTDDQGLVWQFEPGEEEITCMGRAQEPSEGSEWSSETVDALKTRCASLRASCDQMKAAAVEKADDSGDDTDPVTLAEQLDSLIDEAGDAIDEEDYDQASNLLDTADDVSDDLLSALGGTDADDDDEEEGKQPTPPASADEVVVAVRAAKLPSEITAAVEGAKPGRALKVLVSETAAHLAKRDAEIAALTTKAKLGDDYIAKVKADAIDWYTKSRLDPRTNRGVDVGPAQRLIDRCADGVELIKDLSSMWEEEARRRFPAPRRQSAHPEGDDPNTKTGPAELPPEMTEVVTDPRVKRLHSR